MNSRDKKKISIQMGNVAQELTGQDGNELVVLLLQTCNAFLKMNEKVFSEDTTLEPTADVYDEYAVLAEKINSFLKAHPNNREVEAIKGSINSIQSIVGEQDKIIGDLEEKCKKLHDSKQKNEKRIAELEKEEKSLKEESSRFSPERIREMESAIAKLNNEVDTRKQAFSQLEADGKKLENERKKLEQEESEKKSQIEEVERLISQKPEDLKKLAEEYAEKERVLELLNRDSAAYSDEKQEEIRKEIEELTPVVEKKKSDYEDLKNAKNNISNTSIEYDRENHSLKTNLLTLISESINDLEKIMPEHMNFINETKETADKLAENLENCNQRYEEYQNWFAADKTPLEKMMEMCGQADFSSLKEHLNPGQIPEIKEKFELVRINLLDLDVILQDCSGVANEDLKRIKNKAVPGSGGRT